MSIGDVLLDVQDVSYHFGGVQALAGCSFTVHEGETLGLIGPNGAGKTTVGEMICGGRHPATGRILFGGVDISHSARWQIARLGVVRTFQMARLMTDTAVMENAMLARRPQRGERLWRSFFPRLWWDQEIEIATTAERTVTVVTLQEKLTQMAGVLSGGQRKLLELARAAVGEPRMLVLDEPVAGVNPRLRDDMVSVLRAFQEAGVTLLIVEHNLSFIERLCKRVIVMDQGRILTSGTLDEVRADPRVAKSYLGMNVVVA